MVGGVLRMPLHTEDERVSRVFGHLDEVVLRAPAGGKQRPDVGDALVKARHKDPSHDSFTHGVYVPRTPSEAARQATELESRLEVESPGDT